MLHFSILYLMWILYSLRCNTWRYRRKFQWREDIVKLSCFLRLSTRMHVNANANEKKLTLSFTLGCENVGTWLCVLSSRDTYLSTGANRNVFIATAVCKIEEDWDAQQLREKLTMIGLPSRVDLICEIESEK